MHSTARLLVSTGIILALLGCTSDDSSRPDAGTDGSVTTDSSDKCARKSPKVPCGNAVCEGATATCCQRDGVALCVNGGCPAFSDADPTPYGVNESHCDDSKDCPSDTYCCANYDKGLSRSINSCEAAGARCVTALCHDDCDCRVGKCQNGSCM